MKKILTPQQIINGSGCYHQEKVNPVTKTSYAQAESLTVAEFMANKDLPPQDRLWFLINGCDLDEIDKTNLIEVFIALHPIYFDNLGTLFDRYVRKFNKLFYVEKKITKKQVETIITNYLNK